MLKIQIRTVPFHISGLNCFCLSLNKLSATVTTGEAKYSCIILQRKKRPQTKNGGKKPFYNFITSWKIFNKIGLKYIDYIIITKHQLVNPDNPLN